MSKALAEVEQGTVINLPVLAKMQEAVEVMKTNLEGITLQFERIRIPAGGGLAFEVPGDDGPIPAPALTGVILDHYRVNAYWADKFSGQGNPPDCASLDGRSGVGAPGGDCVKCPLNQYGTDENKRGKACKNIHRVYLLPENEVFPWLIALPPSSLKPFNQYIQRLTSKLKPFYSVVTQVKLEKATNKDGISYSRVVLSKVADLDAGQAVKLKEFIAQIKPVMRQVAVTADEYAAEDVDDGGNKGPEPF